MLDRYRAIFFVGVCVSNGRNDIGAYCKALRGVGNGLVRRNLAEVLIV